MRHGPTPILLGKRYTNYSRKLLTSFAGIKPKRTINEPLGPAEELPSGDHRVPEEEAEGAGQEIAGAPGNDDVKYQISS